MLVVELQQTQSTDKVEPEGQPGCFSTALVPQVVVTVFPMQILFCAVWACQLWVDRRGLHAFLKILLKSETSHGLGAFLGWGRYMCGSCEVSFKKTVNQGEAEKKENNEAEKRLSSVLPLCTLYLSVLMLSCDSAAQVVHEPVVVNVRGGCYHSKRKVSFI